MPLPRPTRLAALLLLGSFLFSSCSGPEEARGDGGQAGAEAPLAIASIFPNYDFLRELAGDRLELRLLLPPGVEAHSYEPRPSDLAALSRAELFVYTDEHMEPWARRLAEGAGRPGLLVLESAEGIELAEGHGGEEGEPAEEEGPDPHVWLDPRLAARMVEAIEAGLARIDPEGAPLYAERAAAYRAKLAALDARIEAGLATAKTRTFIYGGHFAFGYFARRYGLDHRSPYPGFSPDAEPSPQALAELLGALKGGGARVVFHEELVEPRVARVLAEATGARLELLHGVHNVSREELEAGVGYLDLMEANLGKLRLALGAE